MTTKIFNRCFMAINDFETYCAFRKKFYAIKRHNSIQLIVKQVRCFGQIFVKFNISGFILMYCSDGNRGHPHSYLNFPTKVGSSIFQLRQVLQFKLKNVSYLEVKTYEAMKDKLTLFIIAIQHTYYTSILIICYH